MKNKEIQDLENKIEELALTIDKVEDEKLEIENKMKKALADYINLERGLDKRLNVMMDHMKLKVAKNLIEMMDDFYYAIEASKNLELDEKNKAWLDGIIRTIEKMKNTLDEMGIVLMDVKKGDKYDVSKHEALGIVKEGENDTIHEVLQPGYTIGENVVRPARVIVSKTA